MTTTPWARFGSILVPQSAAEEAQQAGSAVQVYPDGMEALSWYLPVKGDSGPGAMRRQMSYTGIDPVSGVIDQLDHNRDLPPRVWRGDDSTPGVVDQMVREDPVAKALKLAWTLPIIRSDWTVEPGGEDRADLEIAEFVKANLWHLMRGGWQSFVEQASSMVWRGLALFEVVARFDKGLDSTIVDELSPILPRTINSWVRYDDGLWGIQQYQYMGDDMVGGKKVPGSSGPVNLAPEKILRFTWDSDGGAPEGVSILRPCYGGWKSRRLYLKLEAAGYERGAFGIPYVEVDPTARTGDSAVVNEILRELRTGARAWASFPPGYRLHFADFPMKGSDIREARVAAGQDMARAALAPFLFTGEKAGAFSLIKGQQDFFQLALQAAADGISATLSEGPRSLIKRLVDWNFPNVKQYPRVVPGSISLGDPTGLVTAIKTATEAGMLSPDEGLEESVRSALGLPEMPEATLEQWRAGHTQQGAEIERPEGPAEEPEAAPRAPATPELPESSDDDQSDSEAEVEGLAERYSLEDPTARSGRPLRAEETVVRLDETLAPMVGTKEAIARAVKVWRDAIAPIYADRLAKAGDLSKMRTVQVPDQGKLVQLLQVELRRAYRAGRESVRSEVERIEADPELAQQIAEGDVEVTRDEVIVDGEVLSGQMHLPGCPCGEHGSGMLAALTELMANGNSGRPVKRRKVRAPKPKADGSSAADDIDPERMIRAIAETTTDRAADRIQNDSMTAVQAASLGGELPKDDIVEIVRGSLVGLSIGQDIVQAQRDVNTVFGVGRIQEARAEDVEYGIYSTMLESETCPACEIKDGVDFPISQLDEYATPNPECLGGDLCNCIILFVPKRG